MGTVEAKMTYTHGGQLMPDLHIHLSGFWKWALTASPAHEWALKSRKKHGRKSASGRGGGGTGRKGSS